MSISYEQYVIDNEILGMCMRAVKGIEVNDETLAFDAIKEVGPGGNYLTSMHTVQHMRSEFFYNKVSDRQPYSKWKSAGAIDGREKARKIAKEILATHKPLPIDNEKEIITTIPGILKDWK